MSSRMGLFSRFAVSNASGTHSCQWMGWCMAERREEDDAGASELVATSGIRLVYRFMLQGGNRRPMRIAIISDIHGNLTALDAVLADLRRQKPDVIFHGGDLPYGGSHPAEVIDCIAQEGWKG